MWSVLMRFSNEKFVNFSCFQMFLDVLSVWIEQAKIWSLVYFFHDDNESKSFLHKPNNSEYLQGNPCT